MSVAVIEEVKRELSIPNMNRTLTKVIRQLDDLPSWTPLTREDAKLKKAIDALVIRVMVVTPEQAEFLISNLPKGEYSQRSLNESRVLRYIDALAYSKWRLNGKTAVFTEKGENIDGYHRLTAIARSGKPAPMILVFGVPVDAIPTIDDMGARTPAHALEIQGIKNPRICSAAANYIHLYQQTGTFRPNTKYRMRHQQLVDFVRDTPKLEPACAYAKEFPSRGSLVPRGIIAALWPLFDDINEEDRNRFMAGLKTGADLEAGNPILVLREELVKLKDVGRGTAARRLVDSRPERIAALTAKAWNLYRHGKKVSTISMGSREKFPVIS